MASVTVGARIVATAASAAFPPPFRISSPASTAPAPPATTAPPAPDARHWPTSGPAGRVASGPLGAGAGSWPWA